MNSVAKKNVATRRGIKSGKNWTPLGLYLREKRAEMGLSQKEMAKAIGVTPAYLSALEHGQRGVPSFALLQRIIGYLGVIWDEADQVQKLAQLSNPTISVDTRSLSANATELACRVAMNIEGWSEEQIAQLLEKLPNGS